MQKKEIVRSSEHTSLSNDGAAANESFPPVAGVIGDPGNTLSMALASKFIALTALAVGEAVRPENLGVRKHRIVSANHNAQRRQRLNLNVQL